MNMRKILAVLTCLAMLCTLLPMGALLNVSAADENVVYSADFESGLGTWKSNDDTNAPVEAAAPPVANPNGGSYALKQTITNGAYPYMVDMTAVTLEANTDYVMSFDVLITNASWPVQALVGTDYWFGSTIATSDKFSDASTTEWKTYSFEFNSGSNTKAYIGVKTNWTNTTVYFDNIKVVKKVEEEPEGGETTETSVLSMDWNDGVVGFDSGSVVAEGPDGSNCFKWSATGNWSSTKITVSPIENDVNYVIKFKMKAGANTNVFLTFEDKTWYNNNYYNETVNATTEWKEYTVTTDAGRYCKNGSIYFKFQDTGAAGNFWVDDLSISKVVVADDGDEDFTNLVKNGDFELGSTTNWSVNNGTAVTEDAAMNGKYGLHAKGNGWAGIASQTITVTNGQAYEFSFWYYINEAGFNWRLTGTSSGTNYDNYWPGNVGQWTQVKFEFLATDDSAVLFNLSGYNETTSPDFYIDDVVLKEVKTPSNDGYIINGDFEVGNTTGWTPHQETAVSKEAAYKGNYGLRVKGNGGWGGLLQQSFKVQAEREYILRFAVKAVSQGINIKITDDLGIAAGDKNAKLWGVYYNTAQNGTEWKEVEYRFYTGNNTTAEFAFVGSGTNGAGDELWIDNVSIEKVGGEDPIPNTIVTGGQTSIKDPADNSKGLAFRFAMNGAGAQIKDTNEYISGSAQVKLYKDRDDLYKLVKAGAIMTNNMTIGKDASKMNLDNVDGKKTINIDAKYLNEVEDDYFAFAVRIVNIPEQGLDTNIFARPYFVYEDEDGNEIIEYGNTKSENYNHAANPKASIKVLAIGNSFSQDAINNHLYEVLQSAGYEEIVLGNMYIGGCSLDTHWSNMKNGTAAYDYYYRSASTNGWRHTYSQTLETAINEEDWDYITIQQVSGSSGKIGDYGNLDNCLNWINDNKTNPNAKILWHMTWAYDDATENGSFASYGNDQMTMYRMILDTVNEKVASHSLVDGIIPAGTSIQNMRTSSKVAPAALCEGDGYHLSGKIGDYIAALTWYAYLSGEDVSNLAYQPSEVASFRDDINASVNAAIADPYKVTKCASYDTEKSIKVLSIGHSFSVDVMGTYLYQMLEQAGYEDITIGYLYYPGCQLSRHWEYISTNTNGHERYGKNETGSWVTKNNPYAIDVLRDEDWDVVTLQVSPDYVGGDKPTSGFGAGRVEYDYLPLMIDWIQENAINANVDIKFHQIWAYSEDCELWSYTYHGYNQMTMYNNIIDATQQYVATNEDITGIIPCGTAVQNARALLGDIFNEVVVPGTQADGYHLNKKYGDFLGSLTWACYFSGVDAHTITERSEGMTEAEFSAIADAVNAALADWTQVTVD